MTYSLSNATVVKDYSINLINDGNYTAFGVNDETLFEDVSMK